MMTYSMKVKDEQQKGKEYQLLQQGMGELGDLGVDPGKGGRISRGGGRPWSGSAFRWVHRSCLNFVG